MNHGSIDIFAAERRGTRQTTCTIRVYQAHGGHIVEVASNLSEIGELHIVSEEHDLGSEIGKIITHSLLNKSHE